MSIASPPAPNNGGARRTYPSFFLLPHYWGRGGLLLLCLLVRLAALDADPPPWLSWSTGLYTDEGYYTLDARHEALFGTLAPGSFHDRLLSPLLSLLQQGVFEVFGAGLRQARLLNVCFSLLTVAVFWLALRRASDNRTADFGALFLSLAPIFALYNRLALQETPTVFWLTLGFALWTYGVKWLPGAAIAVAIVFKGLALIALPSLFARRSALARENWGGGVLLFLYLALWYAPHHAELARMATFYRVHQMQPQSLMSLWLNLRRGLIGGERGVVPFLLALLPVPCLLAVWKFWQRHTWTDADKYLFIWLACGLLFCLLSSYAPSRYYVLFLPPLAGLAARGLADWKRPVRIAAAALFLVTSGVWYGLAWTGRTDTRREASGELARLLPPGSVVIGEFAPALCLDTPFAAAPVQPGLSNDDHPVERLHAAAVVVTRTPFWQNWWSARYPGIIQPSHKIATLTLGGSRRYMEDVYSVKSVSGSSLRLKDASLLGFSTTPALLLNRKLKAMWKTLSRYLLSAMMVAAGILHFVSPDKFAKIVPEWLPAPKALVLVSGFFEIAGGLGLLMKQTRTAAAWGLAALFAAVFPANVNMALHKIYTDNPWILWGRLPFQGILIAWAYWFTRQDSKAEAP